MASYELEDKAKLIQEPKTETFRAQYKRRGSTLTIASTAEAQVQVTRHKIRADTRVYYLHELADIEANSDGIKAWLTENKYKIEEAVPPATE